MMADALRSTLRINSMEDTSLVLPSDKNYCTRQERVLQQVNSIKRSKSKMVKNDSLSSPKSPQSVTEHSEAKFQFSPRNLSGSLFRKSSSTTSMSRRKSRMNGHSLSVRTTVRRQTQRTSHCESQANMQPISNSMKISGSDPVLNRAGTVMTQKAVLSRAATVNVKAFRSNQTLTKARSKSESSGMNGVTGAVAIIPLNKAVEYLKHPDKSYQLCGASFIQYHTFTEDKAKQKVCELGGIPALIDLLRSDNSQLQQTAAAALRNVVLKDFGNKLMVENCDGLEIILDTLKNTNITETQKQLTGLLWSLSSADDLKPKLINIGLLPLTVNIVVPYRSKCIDSEVFYNTTCCIRNLSSSNEKERILMRNCERLIESLITHVQSQMERDELNDKSGENCLCILRNLSYQLEKEAPEHFTELTSERKNKRFFSLKKIKTQKLTLPAMEAPDPKGVTWLYHINSLQMYVDLLSLSQRESILEACCGALQNLTASKSPVSALMSETIAEKLKGLLIIKLLLNSTNSDLQRTAMSLVGNMSRVKSLHDLLAKEVLSNVSNVLTSVPPDLTESEKTIVTACQVMHILALSKPKHGIKVLNDNLIGSLSKLSSDMSNDSVRRAAGFLLYSLWKQKDIHDMLKKKRIKKDTFINTVTAASYQLATIKHK